MNTTTKKAEFLDRLNGKPVPTDMFGQTINLGDWFAWGSSSQWGQPLNFGLVVKINYNKDSYKAPVGTIVTSVSVEKMVKDTTWNKHENPNNAIGGFVKLNKKVSIQKFAGGMVVDSPPKIVQQILDGEIPAK